MSRRAHGPFSGLLVVLTLAVAALGAAPTAEAQSGTVQTIRYGEVVSAERVTIRDQPTGRGAQTGATVGAIAGYALADRGDRWLGGLLGGALGAAAGHAGERAASKKRGWELIVRLDGGEEIGIQVADKREKFLAGDRVRLMTGAGGRTKVTRIEG